MFEKIGEYCKVGTDMDRNLIRPRIRGFIRYSLF